MPMEHYRPQFGSSRAGYYQGYYCLHCGEGGMSMYGGRQHGTGICTSNPSKVEKLNEANTEEAESKREFTRKLAGQPSWTR